LEIEAYGAPQESAFKYLAKKYPNRVNLDSPQSNQPSQDKEKRKIEELRYNFIYYLVNRGRALSERQIHFEYKELTELFDEEYDEFEKATKRPKR
jgi:hypothetical protein